VEHFVIVGEGDYPTAEIDDYDASHIEVDNWMRGDYIDINTSKPIIYELEEDDYDEVPNILIFDESWPIPYMHSKVYDALIAAGVDNLQVIDAIIRDPYRGIDYTDYKSFNVIGKVAAADMGASTMMGTSNTDIVGTDFDRLVIDESKCQDLLMFRLAENISAILVADIVKNEIEKRGIEGIFFYPSGEWAG
jgi:hypothetical protein